MNSFQYELEVKLSTVDDLPTLPSIILELERLLHRDAVSAAEVAILIEEDPAMAPSVLRVANSVMFYSSQSGAIFSVQDATVRLGFKQLRELVRTAAFIRAFGKMTRQMDPRRFWRRSLITAVAGRVIARSVRVPALLYED